jgi:hypothetical protein
MLAIPFSKAKYTDTISEAGTVSMHVVQLAPFAVSAQQNEQLLVLVVRNCGQ